MGQETKVEARDLVEQNRQVTRIDAFFDCAERIIKRSKRLFPDAKVAIFDFGLLVVLICEVVRFVYHLLSG